MSDRNKNRKRLITDFFRYHRNELTGAERNSFERELQKDPFAQEAAEGFASLTAKESEKDLTVLQNRLKLRTAGRQRFIFYRIAASITVLIAISALILLINTNNINKRIAVNSIQPEALEITRSQPVTVPIDGDAVSEKQTLTSENIRLKVTTDKMREEPGKSITGIIRSGADDKGMNDTITGYKKEQVRLSAATEGYAASTKVIANERSLKESDNMASKSDLNVLQNRQSAESSISEEIVAVYESKSAEAETQDSVKEYNAPQPVNGKAEFDKYIRENLHRPDSPPAQERVVVVVSFLVLTDGRVDSIRILRSPGKSFSDEAIRLINTGPKWKPAERKGKKTEDEVKLRIVFR